MTVMTAHDLPLQPTSLIGREQEVEAICDRLGDPAVRLLTLIGPAGVGKTQLAIEAASRLRERFDHGAFFIDLAPLSDAALAPSAIARTLGVEDASGGPPIERLKAYLRDKRTLLLLDNAEHLSGLASLAGELLTACPGVRVLVTSRVPLRLRWEHRQPVQPLPVPNLVSAPSADAVARVASVALFVERARAVDPAFALSEANAAAVAALVFRLDGLPLAIELAAARVSIWPPEAILAQLERGLGVLGVGAHDLPARQRTLRDAIGWSNDLLTVEQRAAFRRIGVFAGGFTPEACAAVLGLGEEGALGHIEALVEASLLRRDHAADGGRRFRLLMTVREYARERLDASGDAANAQRRLAAWCLSLAEEAVPWLKSGQRGPWLARLDAELDNIRAALAWCENDPVSLETGLWLASALDLFWHFRDHWQEGRNWLDRLLAQAGTRVIGPVRARALYVAGRLALFLRDHHVARRLLEESATAWRQLQESRGLAYALCYLARLAENTGDYAASRGLATESVSLFRQVSDRWGLGVALYHLGGALLRLGEDTEASAAIDESMAVFRTLSDWWGVALAGDLRVVIDLGRGDLETAQQTAEEGLSMRRALGERLAVFRSLCNIGDVALLAHDDARAESVYQEAAVLREEMGDRLGNTLVLRRLGYIAQHTHQPRRAAALFRECLVAHRERPLGPMAALTLLGMAATLVGERPGVAAALGGAAELVLESFGNPVIEPVEEPDYRQNLAAVRGLLRDERHQAAWAEGRSMGFEQVVTLALSAEASPPEPARPAGAARRPAGRLDAFAERPAGLTPREVEVLSLLAAGGSNREIGDRLVISHRTVERHIAAIYRKIGARRRADAAAFAVRHGLQAQMPQV